MPVPPLPLRLLQTAVVAGSLLALGPSAAVAAPPAKHTAGAQKKGKGSKTHPPKTSKAPPASPAVAPRPPPADASVPVTPPSLDLHRATLDNGLRVVIDVDHGSPTVAIAVTYDAGTRDEERGQGGLARLDARLMFAGSHKVSAGEHARLVEGRGGEVSAIVLPDRTTFVDTLPAGELALGLWLEADRMRALEPAPAAFDAALHALQAEHAAPARTRLEALVYQGYFPYEHEALDQVDLPAALAFHARRHGPGSAVLAIAGDVDLEATLALVHRSFDDVSGAPATAFTDPGLPEQTSQRTAALQTEDAPALFYGWAIPPARSPEHLAIELGGDVLAGGEGSRLHRILVREKGLATAISAGADQRRGPDLFHIEATLAPGAKIDEVQRLVDAEMKALATRGPTPAELLRVRRRHEMSFLLGLGSNQARARRLAEHELCFGDARLLPADLGHALAVTGEEITRAAAQHLGPTRRTLVEVTTKGEAVTMGETPRPPLKAPRPSTEPEAPAPGERKRAPTTKAPPKPAKKSGAKPRKKKP